MSEDEEIYIQQEISPTTLWSGLTLALKILANVFFGRKCVIRTPLSNYIDACKQISNQIDRSKVINSLRR